VVGEGGPPTEEEEVLQGEDTRVEEGGRRAQEGGRHQGGGAGQEEGGAGVEARLGGEGRGPDQDRRPAGGATPAPPPTQTLPDREQAATAFDSKCFFFFDEPMNI